MRFPARTECVCNNVEKTSDTELCHRCVHACTHAIHLFALPNRAALPLPRRVADVTSREGLTLCARAHHETLTISSRRNLSSSRAAGDVVVPLPVPLLPTPPLPGMSASGARRSRRTSSSCLVSASTLATAKLSSFSFSLNSARMESRSLPAEMGTKLKTISLAG